MQIAREVRACNSSIVDPRYIFLVRASTRLWLVDNCEMTLDEAFDDLVAGLQCACDRERIQRWERIIRQCAASEIGGPRDGQRDA